MSYNIQDIATLIKGSLLGEPDENPVEHILLDSRKIIFPATSLFFALQGPRRNGHQFIPELYDKGIRYFIVGDQPEPGLFPGAAFVVVKDTLAALQQLAAHHRKQFSIPVIGITGSNGKTIVKEWLYQLLENRYNIVRSPKSYNSQIGVPLSVWQMNDTHTLGIFEAGISQSGEMQKLEKIIQPTIGIFTNIGEAHSEGFLNIRQKVNEKLQLFKNVGTLIYCKDYPSINEGIASYIQQLRLGNDAEKIKFFSWSTKTDATLSITSILKHEQQTYITATYKEEELSIRIPFTDDASVENAITSWCVLLYLGLPNDFISVRLAKLAHVAMRLELKKGINNCSIINDSYSADMSSLKIALDFLSHQQQHEKRTVILSDILQSGRNEKDLYQEIAELLQQKKINRLIGIGQQVSKQQQIFEKIAGMQVLLFSSVDAFKKTFYQLHFSNETILLKGARIFAFEQISQLLEQKVHQTVLEINLDALKHNLKQFQQLLQPSTKLMGMVKAFSYGSGSYEIANHLQFHKVDYLAVAYADEGVELRKGGITLPIMVMNPEVTTFDALVQFNLEPDIYSFGLLDEFSEFIRQEGIAKFPVHIELETGMNRLGFALDALPQLSAALQQAPFAIQTVFSHLAASEDPSQDAFTRQQGKLFIDACAELQKALGHTFIKHIVNSAGISRHPQLQLDMVRLGIGLYGVDSGHAHLDLQEVSTLKTTIAQIKHIKKGETVGYNRRGVAKKDSVIATVRLGYADGYPRRLGNGVGHMLVNGKPAPVAGSICMDMIMLDITGIADVEEGDEVIVFGKDLSITKVAEWAGTIPYEIMTGISQRVKRTYFEE